ncbi:MAG: choline ABC transporter ATP-binding protein, partial [Pseudomonadota bacterium]
HMNPLGVLCARDVMGPAEAMQAEAVGPEDDIRDVMGRVMGSGRPVSVVEDGSLLGEISKDGVLAKLLDPRG